MQLFFEQLIFKFPVVSVFEFISIALILLFFTKIIKILATID